MFDYRMRRSGKSGTQLRLFILCIGFIFLSLSFIARAQSEIVTAPGNYQSEIGCDDTTGNGGDWEPACLLSQLKDDDGDGIYTLVVGSIPAGDYEFKIAINQSWGENYGLDGKANGANIPLNVPVDFAQVTFTFDPATKAIS